MIKVETSGDQQLPIEITLNSGTEKFTRAAAIELKAKLQKAIDKIDGVDHQETLNQRYERAYNALDYIYESGELSNHHAVEKAKWGLGIAVENEAEVAAFTARFSHR